MTVVAQRRLPMSKEEITTAWLSEEFSARYPGVEVTGFTIDRIIEGTATKLRLSMDYNQAGKDAGLPPTMWLKIGFDALHLEIGSEIYEAEARFYREIAPQMPGLTLPYCYVARTDHETGQTAIFLENLEPRDVRFGDIRRPISLAVVRNLLDWMAILHARYWGDPILDTMGRRPIDTIEGYSGFILQPEWWARYMAGPRAAGVPDPLRDRDNIEGAYLAMLRHNAARTQCLIHGDLHQGNMFELPDGTAGYVDWQGVRSGYWAFDVTYFIVGHLAVADRRLHEKDLLRFYLDRLQHHLDELRPGGVAAPDWDDAWLSYRINLVHGYGWIACPETTQPEEICAMNAERFVAAAIDHDMLGAGRAANPG